MSPRRPAFAWSAALLALGCGASTTDPALDAGAPTADLATPPDVPGTDRGPALRDVVRDDVVSPPPIDAPTPVLDAPTPAIDAPTATVDCARFGGMADVRSCGPAGAGCGVVFSASQGCAAVCAAAGMRCLASHEDVTDACAPDTARPSLGCAATGHQSDYCVCAPTAGACAPSCMGRVCGDDGCGGACGACGGVRSVPRARAALAPRWPAPAPIARPFRAPRARGATPAEAAAATSPPVPRRAHHRPPLRALFLLRGPRTVVFDVAGFIDLRSPLRATVDRLTLAGQTAPGGGVTTQGNSLPLSPTRAA